LIEGSADRGSIGLSDNEHRDTMAAHLGSWQGRMK
jgi:hypothetical protein